MEDKTAEMKVKAINEKFENLKLWGRQSSSKLAGEDGERLARQVFVALGLDYTDIDQSIAAFDPYLKAFGGKRADFQVVTGDPKHLLFVDAKQHSTDGAKVFRISVDEFEKYLQLEAFEQKIHPDANVEVAFIIFPKECLGKCFAMLWLEHFADAKECQIHTRNNGRWVQVPGFEISIAHVLNDSKTGERRNDAK
jgi:hypothetical protein